jgi:hypothetical protein
MHFFDRGMLYPGPTGSIYRSDMYRRLNGFRDYGAASDYDFNLRMAAIGPIALFPRDLFWWRPHDNQEFRIHEHKYLYQNNRILRNFVSMENNPLSLAERRTILRNHERILARKVLVALLSFNPKKAVQIRSAARPGIRSYFRALIPGFLRKKPYSVAH